MNKTPPETILEEWQHWSPGLSHQPMPVSELGNGLTNNSYLLDSNIGKLVLRINNPNSFNLGINRKREALILQQLHQISDLRIGPEIIYMDPQYRYLVYRFIDGKIWTQADLNKQQNQMQLQAVITQYQKVHLASLNPRCYKQYLLDYWNQLEAQKRIDETLQQQWLAFLPELDKADWVSCLTHHDLTPGNIIETSEGLRIIDWEYAHLGHPDLDRLSMTGKHNQPGDSYPTRLIYWINRLWELLAK